MFLSSNYLQIIVNSLNAAQQLTNRLLGLSSGVNLISNPLHNGKTLNAKKIIFPMTLSPLPQLFLINSGMWEQRSEIEIVDSRTLSDTMPELKREEPDVKPYVNSTYSKFQLIDSETPLPEFSPTVLNHLLDGSDVTAIWGTFIDECAKYYFQRYPNIQNSSEYQAIGRKMYNKYPTIELDGKEPWSFFCKSLSQKIRHMKWKIKRKSMGLSRSSKISRKSREKLKFRNLKVDRRYRPSKQYKALLKELSEGWANDSISESRINEIVRDTNKSRRTWLSSHKDRKIFSIIEEFPCFTEGKYVINDFLFLINKSDTTEMMQRLESLFSAVGNMMEPPVENNSFSQKMQILSYMESEVAFTRGKIVSESIFVHKTDLPEEEIMQNVKSIENSFPQLYIFSNGDELKRTLVAGDTTIVNTRTTDLSEAILVLIAAYYTFSLDYPPCFAQILGLLQNFVVGESYEGTKSPKYVKFMHELTNSISDEE
ncbi:hypothetical protein JTE90_008005 [Oedothorax gibbosus]|uniref:Uncharacterized protein n=1 Tax=Oedothorax gibbosus TaxID=931172 RepID=A0AAV6UXL2_9ARAC|nr:hypothetical protein JTE90_008005 [Oedothorax gibbosus]